MSYVFDFNFFCTFKSKYQLMISLITNIQCLSVSVSALIHLFHIANSYNRLLDAYNVKASAYVRLRGPVCLYVCVCFIHVDCKWCFQCLSDIHTHTGLFPECESLLSDQSTPLCALLEEVLLFSAGRLLFMCHDYNFHELLFSTFVILMFCCLQEINAEYSFNCRGKKITIYKY